MRLIGVGMGKKKTSSNVPPLDVFRRGEKISFTCCRYRQQPSCDFTGKIAISFTLASLYVIGLRRFGVFRTQNISPRLAVGIGSSNRSVNFCFSCYNLLHEKDLTFAVRRRAYFCSDLYKRRPAVSYCEATVSSAT